MNGWLVKKSNNWLMQLTIVCNMLYLGGSGGMPPTEKFSKFSLFSIKFGNIFD